MGPLKYPREATIVTEDIGLDKCQGLRNLLDPKYIDYRHCKRS